MKLTKKETKKETKLNLGLILLSNNELQNAVEPFRMRDLDEISREYIRADKERNKRKHGRLTCRVDKSIQTGVEELALRCEVSKTDIFEGMLRKALTSPEVFKLLSPTVQAALIAESRRRGFNS